MHALYYAVLTLLILATLPVWIWRYFTTPKYRGTVWSRLGRLPPAASQPVTPCIWLHAVSVGETLAARGLADRLVERFPGHPLVVTSVTRTGHQMARERIPSASAFHYLPIDLPLFLRPLIAAIRPKALVIMETELWPGLFRELARRQVPIIVVNGRISSRSFRRYHAIRFLTRRLLADGQLYLMQTAADAERLIAMGAPPERVQVTGNLKYDQALTPPDPALLHQLAARLPRGGQPVWMAASTHPGEEEIVLALQARLLAHPLAPRLILVPRHPERSQAVQELARRLGVAVQCWSATRGSWDAPVLLVDQIGWLAGLYRWADLVFMGGSLVPHGGQNMLEPAACGLPILFGPHVFNFKEIAAQLESCGGAVRIGSGEELWGQLTDLLENQERCRAMGAAAQAIIPANAGALDRTIQAICTTLEE